MTTPHRRLICTLSATAAVAFFAPPAHGQDGVTIDPGSPTGKEYAIPLEEARREAAVGPRDGVSSTERSAPLFGAGVGDDELAQEAAPEDAASTGKPGGQRERQKSGRDRDGSDAGGPAGASVDGTIAGTRALQAAVPEGGTSSALTIGAVALSVLLLGGVLGSIARRRSS